MPAVQYRDAQTRFKTDSRGNGMGLNLLGNKLISSHFSPEYLAHIGFHAAATRLLCINKSNCADSLTISVLFCWLRGRRIPYTDPKQQVAEQIKGKVQFSSVTMFFLIFLSAVNMLLAF